MRVSLIIPTQRRPAGLALAARSAFRQAGVDFAHAELVIVDNDQVPSAAAVADQLRGEAPFPVIYVHEPAAGVANARNAGLTAAKGELIAFLDDDEEAPAPWLAALIAAQAAYGADAVFGPVKARAPANVREHRVYLERFFSREGPAEGGVIDGYYGCGNSLIRRGALPDPNRPFETGRRNFIGGEDDLLFGAMKGAGARLAWAPEAWVWEDPVPERLTLGYTIRRAFAYGQGPSEHCSVAGDRLGVAKWMAVGLAQAAAFGIAAGVQWLLRAPGRAEMLDRAARGLGKMLWWGPFKIQFYGRTA
jgi:glycosyltransferase involved in cell wall biosynthesis